jgi:hypothetical protein
MRVSDTDARCVGIGHEELQPCAVLSKIRALTR